MCYLAWWRPLGLFHRVEEPSHCFTPYTSPIRVEPDLGQGTPHAAHPFLHLRRDKSKIKARTSFAVRFACEDAQVRRIAAPGV
jgi:hypothetical protein